MFCPNCGEKLESQNQKFCPNCGSSLSYTPDTPQVKAPVNKVASTIKPTPVYASKQSKVSGPGPNSKMCFAFALVSIALAIVGLSFGAISFIRTLLPIILYPDYPGGSGGAIGLIIAIGLNIAGLIFGIVSKVNSSKAGKLEPINTLERFGSVVSIFGIIINAIPLVIILIMALVSPLIYMPINYY